MSPRRSSIPAAGVAAVLGAIASLGIALAPAHAACPETPECAAPADLHLVANTKTTLDVAWSAVENAPGYRLQYSRVKDFSSGIVGIKQTGTTYQAANLPSGVKYYFRVAVSTQETPTTQLGPWSTVRGFTTLKPFALTVGTYNIKDFDSTDPRYPEWRVRGRLSAGAVVGQGVKIAGLQELFESDERDAMLNFLNEKAGGRYYGMVPYDGYEGDKDAQIVYDKRELEHLKSGGVRFRTQVAGEDRSYAWGKFRHIPSGKYVLFITTHLEPRSDAADVGQWRELLAVAKAQTGPTATKPWKVVITGDFNVSKFEQIGADMFAESRAAGFEDVLGQQYRSYDTYRNPTTRVDAWISTSNRGDRDISHYSVSSDKNGNGIDHVFISKALKAPYYRVYAQPRTGNLMNYLLSDHFLVIAKLAV